MNRTDFRALIGVAVFVVAAFAIVTPALYGRMFAIPASVSLTLWIMAAVCVILALKVRAAKDEDAHGIGLDNSQLNPLTVMNFMLVGKSSAWTGAVVGAAYAGIATYVLPNAGELVAASSDVPGVLLCVTGGIAMAAAGLYLEKHCEVPPPTDGAGAVS